MRIQNLNLSREEVEKSGLKEFQSSRFNHTIALVGKNGSGKTRYLKVIEDKLRRVELLDILAGKYNSLPKSIQDLKSNYEGHTAVFSYFKELKELQNKKKKFPQTDNIDQLIREAQQDFNKEASKKPINPNTYDQINDAIRKQFNNRIKIIKPSDLRRLKESIDINQGSKITFQNIIDSTTDHDIDELTTINESALIYLKRLPHKLAFDDLDTKGDEKKFKNRTAYKRFQLLSRLVEEFLGKKLDWKRKTSNIDEHDDHVNIRTTGYWMIDGREFNYAQFSEGEKVLFSYALLLFLLNTNPKIRFKESIIIIDEPELNLHPKAQIKLIESLQELIKDEGQLIIATHSLSIVANLNYGSIFLVRDGELWPPSSTIPFESVDDLMGFNEHYNKIVEFLKSPPSWAMTNFMAECFLNPEVFNSASRNDPQLEVFKNLILEKKSLKILDFGSGKGRLIERIKELEEPWNRISDYHCFDIDSEYNDLVLEKGAKKVFNDLNQISNTTYDLVVLVNVLHEIHVQHWTKSINKIKAILKPDGILAIVEDLQLPIGELPNEHGFLLLGKEEMTTLFGNKISFIASSHPRYADRIICGLISGDQLKRVNKISIIKTLEKLKVNSIAEIKRYRKLTEKEASLGRLYALKSNLYVNSALAIESLEK